MPVNVVKTPEDELAWGRAQNKLRAVNIPTSRPGPRFYRIVMTIFKNMTHRDVIRSMVRRRRRHASRA